MAHLPAAAFAAAGDAGELLDAIDALAAAVEQGDTDAARKGLSEDVVPRLEQLGASSREGCLVVAGDLEAVL
ncbi:MAG: hypothetical protein QM778_03925 [Myxococcales bacterium]